MTITIRGIKCLVDICHTGGKHTLWLSPIEKIQGNRGLITHIFCYLKMEGFITNEQYVNDWNVRLKK